MVSHFGMNPTYTILRYGLIAITSSHHWRWRLKNKLVEMLRRGKWFAATTYKTSTWWRLSCHLLVTFAHISDFELHCDSFCSFFAQHMRYTITLLKIKGFVFLFFKLCLFFSVEKFGILCVFLSIFSTVVNVMLLTSRFIPFKTLELCFQLGTELWPWRTWTANGHIRKVASQKTVKFFFFFFCIDSSIQNVAFLYEK